MILSPWHSKRCTVFASASMTTMGNGHTEDWRQWRRSQSAGCTTQSEANGECSSFHLNFELNSTFCWRQCNGIRLAHRDRHLVFALSQLTEQKPRHDERATNKIKIDEKFRRKHYINEYYRLNSFISIRTFSFRTGPIDSWASYDALCCEEKERQRGRSST